MPGAAVAAIVAPLAIEAARATGASPHVFALGVAFATSMAFLTPLGHPVNVLVMGPGGYRVREFFKAGMPLVVLLSILILLLVPMIWSLT
jgi:di/tricarboxylate transporter